MLTDLDGTLLEPDASITPEARAALRALAAAAVPVCPATSKTAAELTAIMTRLGLSAPAVFENGAGVLHPDGSSDLVPAAVGVPELMAALDSARRHTGAPARSIHDIGDDELSALTGLIGDAVAATRRRRATLPLVVDREWDEPLREALPPHLRLIRGNRFLHLQGAHSKGNAFASLVAAAPGRGAVVACGDAPNDADLLAGADVAVIVPGGAGPSVELVRRFPRARVAPYPHGRGWAAVMTELLAAPPRAERQRPPRHGARET